MKFSERIGITKPREILQVEGMDERLSTAIWNTILEEVLRERNYPCNPIHHVYREVWQKCVGRNLNELDMSNYVDGDRLIAKVADESLFNWYQNLVWYKKYNFVEGVLEITSDKQIEKNFNDMLTREFSGYRILNKKVVPVTASVEIESVTVATENENI